MYYGIKKKIAKAEKKFQSKLKDDTVTDTYSCVSGCSLNFLCVSCQGRCDCV